jgi:hypothetical protein
MKHPRNQMGVLITPHLTSGYDEILAYQIRTTQPGMAHFANTGPWARPAASAFILAAGNRCATPLATSLTRHASKAAARNSAL